MSDKPAKKRLPKPPLGEPPITQKFLNSLYYVDTKTGELKHRKKPTPSATSRGKISRVSVSRHNKHKAGKSAVIVTKSGAVRVSVQVADRLLSYPADDVAWVMQEGPIPPGKIVKVKDEYTENLDFRLESMELVDPEAEKAPEDYDSSEEGEDYEPESKIPDTASEEIGDLLDEKDPLADMKQS